MSQHLQVYMSCMFGVLIVHKVMKCNNPECSHATTIFHYRLNLHFRHNSGVKYTSGFDLVFIVINLINKLCLLYTNRDSYFFYCESLSF